MLRPLLSMAAVSLIFVAQHGLGPQQPQSPTADRDFVEAIQRHDVLRLNDLLKGTRPRNVNSLLDTAIDCADVAAASLLLAHGANPNFALDGPVETPLIRSARLGREEMVRLLLDAGADPNGRGGLGNKVWFPLYWAVVNRHQEVAALLLTAKANANARLGTDSTGGIVRYVKAGEGETPLMVAARQGDTEMVELLLRHGADPNLADGKGRRAVDYLKEYETPVPRITALLLGTATRR